MLTDLQRVQLGAFLHDIGKFWQRTGEPHGPGFAEFTDDVGAHGAHARWSASFVEQNLPPDFRAAGYPALYHHRPNDYTSKLVAVADRLSAVERDDAAAGDGPRQLVSPFCRVKLGDDESATAPSYYPLSRLKIKDEVIFPTSRPLDRDATREAYRTLWQQFVAEHDLLPRSDFHAYFHGLYYLLFKYGWCVPSAFYHGVPDISLFDHSRITCAIAASLALQGISQDHLDALLSNDPRERARVWKQPILALLGGDLSGIQKFLYTITSEGAARGLCGRSFYLQSLGDTVAQWVLSYLGLSVCNLLYCGGGRFYVLAPLGAIEALPTLRADLSRKLLQAHGSHLYLALDGIEIAPDSLSAHTPASGDNRQARDFGNLWWQIGERLNQAKRRRFGELSPEEMQEKIFSPRGTGGYAQVCSVCRSELPLARASQTDKCSFCQSLEDLGRDLRDARYIVIERVEEGQREERTWDSTLAALGARYSICRDGRDLRRLLATRQPATVLTLGSSNFVDEELLRSRPEAQRSLGFSLHSPVAPTDADGNIADFSNLAGRSQGIKRLGILRMDVDDLGEIFGRGLGRLRSPSRLSSLSLLMRVYFEGWVSRLCAAQNENPNGAQVYPIYSGGDDLLLVGSWSALPDLAATIRRDFARFVAGNPDIHISAGIVLEPQKFPLYQGAEHAREALDDRAKRRRVGGRVVKDAVDFLGQTLSWEEFGRASATAERLAKIVGSRQAPRALIHTIGAIYEQYQAPLRSGKPGKIYFGRWMWLAAYSLTRMAERAHDPRARKEIEDIRDNLFDPTGIAIAGLASRWAELLLRERSD